MTPKELDELAAVIVERRKQEAAVNGKTPYYMLNGNHPALRGLFKHWTITAAPAGCPVSDRERIAWELSLLNDTAIEAIKKRMEV